MERLHQIFEKKSFEQVTKEMMKKNTISFAKQFINKDQDPRNLLSCWLIVKFPNETIGNVKENLNLIKAANDVVNSTQEELPNNLNMFTMLFDLWKKKDIVELKEEIFKRYHQLTVDIMNSPEELKEHLENCKVGLLEQAKKIGGDELVNKILSYAPVILNLEELQQQYDNAFWDLFKEEFENQKLDKLYQILEHIKTIYLTLAPSLKDRISDILDVQFIKQRIEHNAYNNVELFNLTNNIFDILKSLHAPVYDDELEEFRKSLSPETMYFPDIMRKITELTRNIIAALSQFKERTT